VAPRRSRALRGTRTTAFATFLLLVTGLLMLAAFYWLAVDHPPGAKRRVWPGAAAAIVSWLIVSWGFGEYTLSIGDNYALYYGSLAAVAVLLVWLYLTSLALVIGAEVNAELEGAR
jgi:membrane protein